MNKVGIHIYADVVTSTDLLCMQICPFQKYAMRVDIIMIVQKAY